MTTATKAPGDLGKFKGRRICSQGATIKKAGDGLSAPLMLDPKTFDFGDEVFIVLECKVADFKVRPVKDSGDGVQEIVEFHASDAMIVDRELVIDLLAEQKRRIEDAKGIMQLDLDGDRDDPPATNGDTPAGKPDRATAAKASKPPAAAKASKKVPRGTSGPTPPSKRPATDAARERLAKDAAKS